MADILIMYYMEYRIHKEKKLKKIAKLIQIIWLFILFFIIEIVCEILIVLFSSIVMNFIWRRENITIEMEYCFNWIQSNSNITYIFISCISLFIYTFIIRYFKITLININKDVNWGRLIVKMILIGIVSSVCINVINLLVSNSNPIYEIKNITFEALAGMVGSIIIAPVVEEIVFRGVFFNKISEICPIWLAVLISACVFGSFHGEMINCIFTTIMGGIFALTFYKYKSVLPGIIMHASFNLISYFL